MNKMKSMLGMAAIFTAMAYGEKSITTPNIKEHIESDEERKKRIAKAEIERCKAKGLKEFFYGENSVFALNQKSADKKAKKQNLI
jgi:hypothetical protein